MKKILNPYSTTFFGLLLTLSNAALFAQVNTRASAALSSGWFTTFQNAPGNAGADPRFETKYDLKARWPFSIELLFHQVISENSDASRVGFRLLFLSIRQTPKLGSQFYANSSEQQPRLYRNMFFAAVFQRKVYEGNRSQVLLDLSAGLSFTSVKKEIGYAGNREFNFPETGIGVQLGFGYLFRLFESDNTSNFIRVSPRFHFQSGDSFPFSSGFLLDIGIVIQLIDQD